MGIVTKNGDEGKTQLLTGEMVCKDDIRVEAYGTIDELDSCLAEAQHYIKIQKGTQTLKRVHEALFKTSVVLAGGKCPDHFFINEIQYLEEEIQALEEKIEIKGFVIPGSTIQSAKLDLARTICRRAERRIAAVKNAEVVVLKYINRLSDLLFMLARAEENECGLLQYEKLL
jgi:ATP:cob(I)alamin adenosyltransferase